MHATTRCGVLYLITVFVLVVIAFPAYWLVTTAFKFADDLRCPNTTLSCARFDIWGYEGVKRSGLDRQGL
jgi:hypothetical protein